MMIKNKNISFLQVVALLWSLYFLFRLLYYYIISMYPYPSVYGYRISDEIIRLLFISFIISVLYGLTIPQNRISKYATELFFSFCMILFTSSVLMISKGMYNDILWFIDVIILLVPSSFFSIYVIKKKLLNVNNIFLPLTALILLVLVVILF